MSESIAARIRAIRWLADMLADMPNEKLLERVDAALLEAAGACAEDSSTLEAAARRHVTDEGAGGARSLRVEHTGLFCGLRADAPHPYESAYSSGRRLLRQEAERQVRAAYAQAGFPEADSLPEEADFLPYELRFYAWLLEENRMEEAELFNDGHLRSWANRWCEDLTRQAESAFYRAFAACFSSIVLEA